MVSPVAAFVALGRSQKWPWCVTKKEGLYGYEKQRML
jgi:hypothetical protein